MKLSILIPVYNEEKTIAQVLDRVRGVSLPGVEREIVAVDDHSSDRTREILQAYAKEHAEVISIAHPRNMGKGRAIRTALAAATGDCVLIQDADLEYDPNDYPKLLEPILQGGAKVVYGSRFLGVNRLKFVVSGFRSMLSGKRYYYLTHFLGLQFLNLLSNVLYCAKITDEATCYKVFSRDLIRSIPLRCERFEFCPEVTAKVRKLGLPIVEVPIRYHPRTAEEGKKLNWRDGFVAIWTLIKYRFKE